MNIKLITKSLLLALVAVLAGCSSNEEPEDANNYVISISFVADAIKNAPEPNYEKANLPEWLTEFIYDLHPDNIRDVAAFQGIWKGEVIYCVYDQFSSTFLRAIFNSDGQKVNWSEKEYAEFWRSEIDWECVFLSKSKLHDL